MVFLIIAKLSSLPGGGLNVAMARSSFMAGGRAGATALLMKTRSGTSFQMKPSGMKGLGSARWYAMSKEEWCTTTGRSWSEGEGAVGFTVEGGSGEWKVKGRERGRE